jgi:hypothetical protein
MFGTPSEDKEVFPMFSIKCVLWLLREEHLFKKLKLAINPSHTTNTC